MVSDLRYQPFPDRRERCSTDQRLEAAFDFDFETLPRALLIYCNAVHQRPKVGDYAALRVL